MKYFIVLIVVAVLFFVFRGKIKKFILQKNNNRVVKNINSDLVYTPIASSRTFDFTIEIVELGGGRATLNVLKKDKQKTIDI